MLRCVGVLGMLLVGLFLFVEPGFTGDAQKDPPMKTKGMLPPGWKSLKLSPEQTLKIYGVQNQFKAKVQALEDQIKDLRTQERGEMYKLLTDAQKAELIKIQTGETDTKKSPVPNDPKKEDKK